MIFAEISNCMWSISGRYIQSTLQVTFEFHINDLNIFLIFCMLSTFKALFETAIKIHLVEYIFYVIIFLAHSIKKFNYLLR